VLKNFAVAEQVDGLIGYVASCAVLLKPNVF